MADVFLSYRNLPDRRALVQRIATILRAYEISVWWDYGLDAGSNYHDQIMRELQQAHLVVPVWCEESVLSEWVQKEAAAGQGRLFPIRLQRVAPPADFEAIHAIHLEAWNGSILDPVLDEFISDICERLNKPSRLPPDMKIELSRLPRIRALPPAKSRPKPKPAPPPLPRSMPSPARNLRAPRPHQNLAPMLGMVVVTLGAAGLAYAFDPLHWRSSVSHVASPQGSDAPARSVAPAKQISSEPETKPMGFRDSPTAPSTQPKPEPDTRTKAKPTSDAAAQRPTPPQSSPSASTTNVAAAVPSLHLARPRIPPDAPRPSYPVDSLMAREEGETRVTYCADSAGRVTKAEVKNSSGHPALDQAAVEWVRSLQLMPGSRNGIPHEYCDVSTTVSWTLPKRSPPPPPSLRPTGAIMPVRWEASEKSRLAPVTVFSKAVGSDYEWTIEGVYPEKQLDGSRAETATFAEFHASELKDGKWVPMNEVTQRVATSVQPGGRFSVRFKIRQALFSDGSHLNIRLCIGSSNGCFPSPGLDPLDGKPF